MNTKKLFLLTAVLFSTGFLTVRAQTADEIIGKHIDAMGGSDNWNKIKSMKLTGSISSQGMEITMSQTTVQNKASRMDMNFMGKSGYSIITPTGGWAYMPMAPGMDKVTALPDDQVKSQQSKLNIKSNLILDKSEITKSEYLGKDTLNSVVCHKVKVTDKQGNEQTAYFDASSYYELRCEMKLKVMDQEQEVAVNFSDFKKQPEGIVYPMTWGTTQGDINFKSIEINKPVDESIFKPTEPATESKK